MLPSSIWIRMGYFTGIGDLYLELVTLRYHALQGYRLVVVIRISPCIDLSVPHYLMNANFFSRKYSTMLCVSPMLCLFDNKSLFRY